MEKKAIVHKANSATYKSSVYLHCVCILVLLSQKGQSKTERIFRGNFTRLVKGMEWLLPQEPKKKSGKEKIVRHYARGLQIHDRHK